MRQFATQINFVSHYEPYPASFNMFLSRRKRASYLWFCFLLIAMSCIGVSGCAWGTWKPIKLDELRGDGYASDDEESGSRYRSPDVSVLPAGLNSKAQEIEKSLGVSAK